jgi:hypothetical protein
MTHPLIEMLNGATRGDCKSQIPVPVLEQALETAARIPGSDRSRGYCLEMICADFLAGAGDETGDTVVLLGALCRYSRFLPREQQIIFRGTIDAEFPKAPARSA